HPEMVSVLDPEVIREGTDYCGWLRENVRGCVRQPQDGLEAEEHADGDRDNGADLERALRAPDRRQPAPVPRALVVVGRPFVERRDLVTQLVWNLAHAALTGCAVADSTVCLISWISSMKEAWNVMS